MKPEDLIRPGARWDPGAWTPARCALYETLSEQDKAKMMEWVWKERVAGRCNPHQIPERFRSEHIVNATAQNRAADA